MNTLTSTLSIFTTENEIGIDEESLTSPVTYTVIIYLQTEAGTDLLEEGQYMQLSVTITDPCLSAFIDLS